MSIKFFRFEQELVRDNHGCPCRTDYRMKFTVDNFPFNAESNDFSDHIYIYRGGELVTEIPVQGEKPHNPQAWHQHIEKAFEANNSFLQKKVCDIKGGTCEKVANGIVENLMTDPDLAWI